MDDFCPTFGELQNVTKVAFVNHSLVSLGWVVKVGKGIPLQFLFLRLNCHLPPPNLIPLMHFPDMISDQYNIIVTPIFAFSDVLFVLTAQITIYLLLFISHLPLPRH